MSCVENLDQVIKSITLNYTDGIDNCPQELLDVINNSPSLNNLYYFTEGTIVKTNKEENFIFYGSCLSGTEYDYPEAISATFDDMKKYVEEWKLNTLRLPINPKTFSDFYNNKNYNYIQFIDVLMIRAFTAGFKMIVLDIHTYGQDFGINHYTTLKFLLKKYKNIKVCCFEPLNEYCPSDSKTINKWWIGDGEQKNIFGVKDMLDLARDPSKDTYTTNLLIFGGVDCAYQLNFLKPNPAQKNPNQNFDINTVLNYQFNIKPLNILFNSHPYGFMGYKGKPSDYGCQTEILPSTDPIFETISNSEGQNYVALKNKDILDSFSYVDELGWVESFLWIINDNFTPLIFTEFGENTEDPSIMGGFYYVAICQLVKQQNLKIKGSLHIISWALVFENWTYQSLLTLLPNETNCNNFVPTGFPYMENGVQKYAKALKEPYGPAIPGDKNNNFTGPGFYYKNFVNQQQQQVVHPIKKITRKKSMFSKIIKC